MPIEETGVGVAGKERRVTQRAHEKVAVGDDAVDTRSGERPGQRPGRFPTVRRRG